MDNEVYEINKLIRLDKIGKLVMVIGWNNKIKFREFLGLIVEERFYLYIVKVFDELYKDKFYV